MLVKQHQQSVYRYLRYLGAGASTAEDLTQETFLAAFRNSSPPDMTNLRLRAGWLRGISRNLLLAYFRRQRSDPVRIDSDYLQQAEDVWSASFGGGRGESDYVEALRLCVGSLPEQERRALEMRYTERRSRAEMARLRRMSEDGIKSLMRRIRSRLADCVRRRLQTGGAP